MTTISEEIKPTTTEGDDQGDTGSVELKYELSKAAEIALHLSNGAVLDIREKARILKASVVRMGWDEQSQVLTILYYNRNGKAFLRSDFPASSVWQVQVDYP